MAARRATTHGLPPPIATIRFILRHPRSVYVVRRGMINQCRVDGKHRAPDSCRQSTSPLPLLCRFDRRPSREKTSPFLYLYLSISLSRKKIENPGEARLLQRRKIRGGGGIKAARVNWRDRGKKNRDRE